MATKANRAAKGGGTIRRRPDGRWEGRYTSGIAPQTGKQIQKSVYGKTQKEVRQKLTMIVAEVDAGIHIEPSLMKLSDWLKEWLENYNGNVKQTTIKVYQDCVRVNIIPELGDIPIAKLTTPMVQKLYNSLQKDKGLSAKSIKNVHGVLHKALQQAQKMGYIRSNPTDAVTLPRIEKKDIRPLEDKDLIAFLTAIKGHRYELVYYVTAFTGLREGEVLGLTWDCVDFEQNTLFINKQHGRSKGSKEYHFSSLKNDKPRTIVAPGSVMGALRKQLAQQAKWKHLLGAMWKNEDNLVFTTEQGRYLCNHSVYQAFKRIVKKLDLPNTRFHDLRHTYAVNSLRSGDDIKTVQENLGHHTAAFTLDVYAHVTAGMKKDSADRMEGYIQSIAV